MFQVAIVITDGAATHHDDAVAAAENLRNSGVSVFVIGNIFTRL